MNDPKLPELTKEQLARVDVLARELAEIVGSVILNYDGRTGCCIVVAHCAAELDQDDPDGRIIPPRVEYQVSDGLPGERASSLDETSYEAAVNALPGVAAEAKTARLRNLGRR